MLRKNTFFLLTSVSLLAASLAHAETANSSSWLPDHGRVLATGTAASDVRTIGGDAMVPVLGSKEGFAYADFMGDYGSDDTYLISPGLGYRKVINNQIAGAYFFGDYEKTSLGQNFWVLSPGLEWMNAHWDAHANGYFPTETSKQSGSTAFLDTYGDYSQVTYEEHNQYNALAAPYAVIGNGVDGEIGYSFSGLSDLRTRVYIGGYFYAPPSSDDVDNITGITAGFEQPITKNVSLSIFNSYDNIQDYVIGVGLTATFGQDSTVFTNNIQDRLLDPVERHVGIINTGAGTYDQQHLEDAGYGLEYDNVYFIEPQIQPPTVNSTSVDSTDSIGTYENPAPLTQDTLDAINAESATARIYIQGGSDATYVVDATTATYVPTNPYLPSGLYVYSGQDFYGTSVDYTQPAEANEQPIISVGAGYTGFIAYDTQENTFSDLTISGQSQFSGGGIVAWNDLETEQTVNIINTNMLRLNGSGAVYANNVNGGILTVNIDNSNIYNTFDDRSVFAYNQSTGTLNLNLTDSTVTAGNDEGIRVYNNDAGTLNMTLTNSEVSGNQLNIYAENKTTGTLNMTLNDSIISGSTSEQGMLLLNDDIGTFNTTLTNTEVSGNGSGIDATNQQNGTFNMTVTDSIISDNAGNGILVQNTGAGSVNMTATNTVFDANRENGISISNSATGLIDVSNLSGSSFTNNTGYGINATSGGGAVTVNYTGATFRNNGEGNTNYGDGDNYVTWIPDAAP